LVPNSSRAVLAAAATTGAADDMILLLCADDVNRTLVLGPTGNAATPGVLAILARIHKAWGVLLNCIQNPK
jgi:hypothetical protein